MSLGTLGKYERISILGRGVSGIVYLAKDTLLNRQVALKEVDVQAGDLRRFLEEARVMDRLRHPHIVHVNGVDRIEDKVVIDMEYVRGRNLQETLRAEGPFGVGRSLDIGIQVLEALEYAHSMQTVHRDIKPANILLQRDGEVKLADFGLAEILATNAYACGAGTYAYMAPEDFEEESHSDSQSDIWAVAVTVFEMLTGERPFEVTNPKSPFAWKRALESQEPRSARSFAPDVSPALDAAISRGLARDKQVRFSTARQFRDALDAVLTSEMPGYDRLAVAIAQDSADRFSPSEGTARLPDSGNPWVHKAASGAVAARQAKVGHTGPDTVVSVPGQMQLEKSPTPQKGRVPRLLHRNRQASMAVWPNDIDFGTLRAGESRSAKVTVRISNLTGGSAGRITAAPDWISVEPDRFETTRQALSLTVHTDRTGTVGLVDGSVQIETAAGSAAIPVRVNVRKPRLTFQQVALWFVPLYGVALAPAVITATMGGDKAMLAPPAAASSLALGLMLLLISASADTGIGERIACGVMMAGMCFVLGQEVASQQSTGYNGLLGYGIELAAATGISFGLLLVVQFLTFKRWKFWSVVMALLGLFLSSACYHVAVS